MIITEIYIKNFGMLSERRLRFSDGVQVLYGENESGKSTLHAFIRAMLFGMERGRGKAAAKDAFTRYEPWENPGSYAGVLWFRCGGKRFRLERNFDRYTKRASLVCEDDGEELSVEHGDLEMLLGGMSASLYDSTVSVGQLAAAPGQELSSALENYAANFCETGGGDIDVNGALKSLREKQKETEKALHKAAGARDEMTRKMLQECRYLEQDIADLSAEYKEKKEQLAALRGGRQGAAGEMEERKRYEDGKYTENGEETGKREGQRNKPAAGVIAGGLAAVFAGICGSVLGWLLSNDLQQAAAGGLVFAVSVILFLAGAGILATGVYIRTKAGRNRAEEANKEEFRADRGSGEAERIRWEMERIRAEWKEKEIRCSNLREQSEETEPGDTEKNLARRCRALKRAQEQVRLAAEALGRQTAGRLNKKASDIFAELTEGRYQNLEIGEKLQISAWDGTRRIPADRLSRGTLEQIWFSVRMASSEILQDEPMPVILDDTFALYDEKRLQSVLKWLSRQKRQVIILTCSKREEEILRQFRKY